MTHIKVTSVANAGVLFRYGGTSILVDGLYGDEPHAFSNPPAETAERLMRGNPPFESVDFLLVTHLHPDHATPGMIRRYLEGHRIRGIFLPEAASEAWRELESYMRENGIPFFPLLRGSGKITCPLTEHISLQILPTLHSGREYRDVPHFCYILNFEGNEFLITGDVDYTEESFDAYREHSFRCIFLNPLFFHTLHDPAHFHGHLKYEDVCVYHIPNEEDDSLRIRHMIWRDFRKWPEGARKPLALERSLQTFIL